MRLLLFFISFLFSAIFYSFYNLSVGINFFGKEIYNQVNFDSLSGNLLIESIIFFIIGIFFLFYFLPSNTKNNKNSNNLVNNKYFFYIIFYFIFFIIIFSGYFQINKNIFSIILIFLFGDFCFNFLGNFNKLKKQQINLKYFGLILNYLSIIFGNIYLLKKEFSLIIFFILIFNIIFNFYVHKNYLNYVSLFFSIFSLIILLYFLFLKLYDFYIIFS